METSTTKKYQKHFKEIKADNAEDRMDMLEFLDRCTTDASLYAGPAERMLKAIGEPKYVQTSKSSARMGRVFGNREIRTYDAFKDFYGIEDVIDQIVSFFKHAAQNLEESRQILYLLGPVGSCKSSLVECLKKLMEKEPIYVLADHEGNRSPILEHPINICDDTFLGELGLTRTNIPSPWAVKRLKEYKGDISRFTVHKIYPNQLEQLAITKTEPGDENNQDISSLVGKIDIRKLEKFAQNDPDAYSYSGGLCLSNQGILDFVEMFKAPIKMLHPLLTATQEKNYKGTEALSAIPFGGIICAHSNTAEWDTFKKNKNNEAFLDRVYIVEVPYCLRVTEEIDIYKKLLDSSKLKNAPIAPHTLRMLAEFCVLTRLDVPANSSLVSKMKVYDGENVKEQDKKVKSLQEYKDAADREEGFLGVSTRSAYKIISKVFNFDPHECAADPIHLLYVLEKSVSEMRLHDDVEEHYLDIIKSHLSREYLKDIEKDIQTAYLDSYGEYGQALFDKYILFADCWIQDNDYRDPDTNQMLDREALNRDLEKLEKPADIINPKDFRHEIVNFALRHRAQNNGKNPEWTSYEKLRRVIEVTMFSKTQDLLPVISFSGQGKKEDKDKHEAFINRMKEMGYTERQVRRIVEWQTRATKE